MGLLDLGHTFNNGIISLVYNLMLFCWVHFELIKMDSKLNWEKGRNGMEQICFVKKRSKFS